MKSLKNVLLINGVSSGATGIILLVAGQWVAGIFGVTQAYAFQAVGIFLIGFAILVCYEGVQPAPRNARVRVITVLDTAWVISSFVIVALQLFQLSVVGYILIAGVALWVAAMALLQANGLRRITNEAV